MSKLGWRQLAGAAALACASALPATARAQGVTTGGIGGTVTDEAGQPVGSAQVQVINRATGYTTGTVTRDNGRYQVLALEPGGPYSVVVRLIGYQQVTRDGLRVPLSQIVKVDITLSKSVAVLTAVKVVADANAALINQTRTGVVSTVSDSALHRLPTLNRNFTDFVALTPQVSVTDAGGTNTSPRISAIGVNNRYNSIQIDGAQESDLFGLGATGQPGGQANGKSIGIEAVKEYQVLVTPFDVRQANFAGALINAVSKSGTNSFSGSAYYTGRNESFTRDQPYISQFDHKQYGFSLGGPIIKDRIHFFVNPEFQKRAIPAPGPYLGGSGASASYIDSATVARFNHILDSAYAINGGSAGFRSDANPLTNVFARLDFALPYSSRLVVRHNYAESSLETFSRDLATGSLPVFKLSSQFYDITSKKNASVAQLYTNWANGANNEIIAGYTTIRDNRATPQDAPQISVQVPRIGGGLATLRAGTENSSHRNKLDQDIVELTDNLTIPWRSHSFTVGARGEFYKAANLFGQNLFGNYTVNFTCPTTNPNCNLDSLAAGGARQYQVGVPFSGDPNKGTARFSAGTWSTYAQDQWAATSRLTVTAGLRIDAPFFSDKPTFTQDVLTVFGRDTRDVPTGNLQYSPRVGVNWDITGDQRNQLRGGVGVFVGRPAYVWLGNAFQNSGSAGVGQLTCSSTAQGVPRITTDSVPSNCTNSALVARPDVNLLDPDLKFPQFARTSVGFDRRIGDFWVATIEGVYNNAMYNFFFDNIAKQPTGVRPTSKEYAGRVFYADSVTNTGTTIPHDIGGRRNVIDIRNQSKDYSYSLTGQLQRKFQNHYEGSIAYTYTQARDVQSYSSSVATSNWRQGRALAGNLSNEDLGRSKFEQPHRIVANGTYSFRTKTDLSLIYIGSSGQPYDYVYSGTGDMNGDGQVGNDLVYVPKSAYDTTEIRLSGTPQQVADQQATFEHFIQGEKCLREQRGRIMSRNTCRSPWSNIINLSIKQSLPAVRGQNLGLQLDVFNFGNLLNSRWGRQPFINNAGSSSINLLSQTGATTALGRSTLTGRPILTFDPRQKRFDVSNIESNYQLQLSVRYSF